MPSASHASDGSRVIRTMTRADLDSACRILVDRGSALPGSTSAWSSARPAPSSWSGIFRNLYPKHVCS